MIRLGNIAPLKDPDTRVLVRFHKDREPERRDAGRNSRNKRSTDALTKAGYELFDELRSLRLTIAREEGMPPYIVFSDRTLADMSAKAPCDKASMLRVSGVGEAKYEKYGSRFIQAVTEFLETHPDCVTSLAVQEDGPENGTGAGPEETGKSKEEGSGSKKRKKPEPKRPFFLNPGDGEKFEYKDLYYIVEIKDELNRITTAENVKQIFGTDIFRVLTRMGYVEEKTVDGRSVQVQTEAGLAKGIVSTEKTSKAGKVYSVLMYPPVIQKEIVEYYMGNGEQLDKNEGEL